MEIEEAVGKGRKYLITWNNYEDKDKNWRQTLDDVFKDCVYGIWQREIGEECKTPHIQGYIKYSNPRSAVALRKKMNGSFILTAYGDDYDNQKYCSKEETRVVGTNPVEYGKPTHQGERTDLKKIHDRIKEGTTVDDLAVENPFLFHQYGRTLERLETIELRNKFRYWMTTCDWIYGPTGVGKSHIVFENFDPKTHYVVNLNSEWWDGYKGQPYIIINEFRGQIKFSELLDLCDKYPKNVKVKYREHIPFLGKHIYITSCMSPVDVYSNICKDKESLHQLLRRIKVYYKGSIDSEFIQMELEQKCSEGNNVPSSYSY